MKEYEDLAKLLNNVKGKVCLSYYPHPKVDELYPDWRRDQKGGCRLQRFNTRWKEKAETH